MLDNDFKSELRNAKTMSEVFRVCEKFYDLDKDIGAASKGAVIIGIKRAIKLINAKRK